MPNEPKKNEYARSVALFLAELLRTRKTNLIRAAEIAQKVVNNINLIDTEHDFLRLIKELSADFEELNKLEPLISFNVHRNERREIEIKVRQFVVSIVSSDMGQALAILQEAIKDDSLLEDLCQKFPQFNQFIQSNKHL